MDISSAVRIVPREGQRAPWADDGGGDSGSRGLLLAFLTRQRLLIVLLDACVRSAWDLPWLPCHVPGGVSTSEVVMHRRAANCAAGGCFRRAWRPARRQPRRRGHSRRACRRGWPTWDRRGTERADLRNRRKLPSLARLERPRLCLFRVVEQLGNEGAASARALRSRRRHPGRRRLRGRWLRSEGPTVDRLPLPRGHELLDDRHAAPCTSLPGRCRDQRRAALTSSAAGHPAPARHPAACMPSIPRRTRGARRPSFRPLVTASRLQPPRARTRDRGCCSEQRWTDGAPGRRARADADASATNTRRGWPASRGHGATPARAASDGRL